MIGQQSGVPRVLLPHCVAVAMDVNTGQPCFKHYLWSASVSYLFAPSTRAIYCSCLRIDPTKLEATNAVLISLPLHCRRVCCVLVSCYGFTSPWYRVGEKAIQRIGLAVPSNDANTGDIEAPLQSFTQMRDGLKDIQAQVSS